MVPIFEPLILYSHCAKQIIGKNVWKFNLKTITMTVVFSHSYVLNVQIFSTHNLKVGSPIWFSWHLGCIYIFCPLYYITIKYVDDIKNEISLYYPIDNRNGNKKVGLIRAYFIYSFYNVKKDEKIHLKNGEMLKVERGCYAMKDIEKVSSGKVKYDSWLVNQ